MKTQLIPTASKLLIAKPQLRVELPASADQMARPGGNSGNHRLVIELALTIELRIHDSSVSPPYASVNVGLRMD